MTPETTENKSILFGRLMNKGIDEINIPGFLRSLANSIFVTPSLNRLQIKNRLRYLGWDGFDLDYHTLQLALAIFDSDGLHRLDGIPKYRFDRTIRQGEDHTHGDNC